MNKIYIYGSHNGSNTVDAVLKTSKLAINKLFNLILFKYKELFRKLLLFKYKELFII